MKFDDRPVPLEALTKKFSVDPGKHRVLAEGSVNGFPATFDEEYDIKEKDFITVRITLKPPANDYITPGQIKCMLAAKTEVDERFPRCVTRRAMQSLFGRALSAEESAAVEPLARTFVASGHHYRALVKAIVTSPVYRRVR